VETVKDILIKWFMRINAFLLRLTNGRLGSRLGTQTILLLETIGRTSGKPREIPIAYFFHEGRYLIVESNWGRDTHADWYFNLKVNGRVLPVEAHDAQGEEYNHLWEYVTAHHSPYLHYQEMTKRHISIVVFQPLK
jgi:F420H(2)-dependent quinone reductase